MQRSFGLLSMATAIFIVSTTNATVYFVDHDVIVSGDGSSWPNAYKTLQEALDEADGSDGADIINIADGTYKSSTPSGHGATFLMEPSVSIIGGWAGVSNESPNREFITILSGDLNGDDGANFANRSDNAYHVVSAINVLLGNTVILDGVTIKGGIGGSLTTPLDTDYGGGIWLLDAESPRITNCIITENMAVFGAGA